MTHVCGPECIPGWRLRDIIEFGAVYGLGATQAVIAWDTAHPKRPTEAPILWEPHKEDVRYGNE